MSLGAVTHQTSVHVSREKANITHQGQLGKDTGRSRFQNYFNFIFAGGEAGAAGAGTAPV